jgi:hypothetical protein
MTMSRAVRFMMWAMIAGALAAPIQALAATSPKASARPASRDGWPDTPAAAMARRWVVAFSKGDSAMRVCLAEVMTPEAIAQRGIAERITTYRASRERFGTLVLGSIDKSKPAELEATLIASDLSKHKFVFTVQNKPPYKLVSVGRLEHRGGGHGFGH